MHCYRWMLTDNHHPSKSSLCYITNHLITGPFGNQSILFPKNLNVSFGSASGNMSYVGNKISSWDQLLSVEYCTLCFTTECAMEYTGPVSELKEMCEIRIEVAGM